MHLSTMESACVLSWDVFIRSGSLIYGSSPRHDISEERAERLIVDRILARRSVLFQGHLPKSASDLVSTLSNLTASRKQRRHEKGI